MTYTLTLLVLWLPLVQGDQVFIYEREFFKRDQCERAAVNLQMQRRAVVLFSRCAVHRKGKENG